MNVLVTGATGFVGQTLVRRLVLHEGDDVRCAIRKQRNGLEVATHVHVVGEVDSSTDWQRALVDVDCVVHLAARVHVMKDREKDPMAEFRRVNVEGTTALVRQAIAAGVSRLILLSTVKVNGEGGPGAPSTHVPYRETDVAAPCDDYALSKYEAECALQSVAGASGMEWVIVRPPLVYGPGVRANFAALKRVVRRGYPLPLGAVNNQRSLVALDNLVDLIVTCSTHPQAANQTFLVSDGQDLSTTELVRGMAQAAGVPARLLPVPVWALQAGALLLGKGDAVQRLCGNLQVDISKARRLLDWVPPVSVAEGLRRAMAG